MKPSKPRTTLCLLLISSLFFGCSEESSDADGEATTSASEAASEEISLDGVSEAAADEEYERARQARLDEEYPLHGLVTGIQLRVRSAPENEASIVGWLRTGSRIRMKGDPLPSEGCATGWYELAPRGFACAGRGIEVGSEPPNPDFGVAPSNREATLPYEYYYVKEPMVPQYHNLPSRDQQRSAQIYADRYLELLEDNERRAARFLAGELRNEPQQHSAVGRYLNLGFWLAGTGTETRSRRQFVRTVSGGYVKKARLEARVGSSYQGVEVNEERPLPIPFAVRAARPLIMRERDDGSIRWVRDEEMEAIERHTIVPGWVERRRVGDHIMHILEGDRYLKDWFIGVASRIEPPFEIEEGEPWVHVDLSEQTLVVYRGEEPVFATLISSGLDEHATPVGTFTIRRKFVADTMANLGPDAGDDRYRIEDVPWTQYFEGSFALHGAMWHNRFGLQRSHGCVNLSPADARRVWTETWPRIPDGWHGVSTDRTGFRGSRVHVTE